MLFVSNLYSAYLSVLASLDRSLRTLIIVHLWSTNKPHFHLWVHICFKFFPLLLFVTEPNDESGANVDASVSIIMIGSLFYSSVKEIWNVCCGCFLFFILYGFFFLILWGTLFKSIIVLQDVNVVVQTYYVWIFSSKVKMIWTSAWQFFFFSGFRP